MTVKRFAATTATVVAASIVGLLGNGPLMGSGIQKDITLAPLGVYRTGLFDQGGSEIAAYDPATKRVFGVNLKDQRIDVLDISDPSAPSLALTIPVANWGSQANSVAVHDGIVAVAVEAFTKTDPGTVAFFSTYGALLGAVPVGALPDMLTFTPTGTMVLVANEGEPSIRIFGPGATVAQDLEPEYIAVSHDSKTAWVTLQENNAIGILDLGDKRVTTLVGLGFKDHSLVANGFDASDRDNHVNAIQTRPVFGMYQPDGIATFESDGRTYLITANEGDVREWPGLPGCTEAARVGALLLDRQRRCARADHGGAQSAVFQRDAYHQREPWQPEQLGA
jgi:DNA-binding beta-propeller fold protein YncE